MRHPLFGPHTGVVPRDHRPLLVATIAGAVVAVAASCTAAADAGSATSPPPSPATADVATPGATSAGTPGPTPSDDRTATVRTSAGTIEIEVRGPAATATTDPSEGSAAVALDLTDAATVPDGASTVSLVSEGAFVLRPDGSVTVTTGVDGEAADGTAGEPADEVTDAVGGLTAPDGARFRQGDPRLLELVADDGATGTVGFALGARGVESTDWGVREGGRSLAVTPTAWARQARTAGVDLVWSELVADDPEIESATMHDQLVCHSIGAPDKATWNLEPWRPDVGLLTVLAERCNPTE
jgi:hypothetical protein